MLFLVVFDQLRVLLALSVQRPDHLGARIELHGERRGLHARLRLRAAQGAHVRTDMLWDGTRSARRAGSTSSLPVFFYPTLITSS
jgi:hypothetical protein